MIAVLSRDETKKVLVDLALGESNDPKAEHSKFLNKSNPCAPLFNMLVIKEANFHAHALAKFEHSAQLISC